MFNLPLYCTHTFNLHPSVLKSIYYFVRINFQVSSSGLEIFVQNLATINRQDRWLFPNKYKLLSSSVIASRYSIIKQKTNIAQYDIKILLLSHKTPCFIFWFYSLRWVTLSIKSNFWKSVNQNLIKIYFCQLYCRLHWYKWTLAKPYFSKKKHNNFLTRIKKIKQPRKSSDPKTYKQILFQN